ncbi:hypothetical protein V8C34DRAFT_296707 [Trichoderma compactum]
MHGLGTCCGKYSTSTAGEVRAFPVLWLWGVQSSASAALHHWKSITQAQSDPALSKSPGQPEQLPPARATSPPTLPRHTIRSSPDHSARSQHLHLR